MFLPPLAGQTTLYVVPAPTKNPLMGAQQCMGDGLRKADSLSLLQMPRGERVSPLRAAAAHLDRAQAVARREELTGIPMTGR